MSEEKIVKLYLGTNLENKVIEQDSEILVVLLPGIGYTLDMPLMLYSKKLALEMGFEVLPVKYLFQLDKEEVLSKEKVMSVVDESYNILEKSLYYKYKRIIFIGKSVGTLIQRMLQDRLKKENFKGGVSNIYLTPLDKTVELGLQDNSLVVFGTRDSYLNNINKEKVKMINTIEYLEIKDSGHSLDIKTDVVKSIDIIREVITKEKEFLKNIRI